MMESFSVSITTMTDGSRTVAEAVLSTKWTRETMGAGTGSSGRGPGDKSDDSIGKDLAIARALHSLASHVERRAKGRTKHADDIRVHKTEIAIREASEQPPADAVNQQLVNTLAEAFKINPWGNPWGPSQVVKPPHDF